MTLSQRAIEAAARAIYERAETYPKYALRQMNDILAADLAQAALTAALAVDGVCLVPCEPTGVMREAGAKFSAVCCAETGCIVGEVYRAMLAAANDGEERK